MVALPTTASIQMGVGTQWMQNFTIKNADGSLYPIAGTTWELAVRSDASEASAVTPVIKVTSTASASGVISVDPVTATVTVTVSPAATSALAQKSYVYSLWMNPGTGTATAWVTGTLFATLIALA